MSSFAFAQLGRLPHDSTSCSHGYSAAQEGTNVLYPYNLSAMLIMDQILVIMKMMQMEEEQQQQQQHLVPPSAAAAPPPYVLPPGVATFWTLYTTPECVSRIDANLVKACVMIGTDVLRSLNEKINLDDDDSNEKVVFAIHLAATILHLEEYLNFLSNGGRQESFPEHEQLGIPKVKKAMLSLDCPRNIVMFYESRNTCSCLAHAKEMNKERMGHCGNPICNTYSLDTKLLTCKGCEIYKYCTKECQVAHWPEHKGFCKLVRKGRKQAPNNK